MVFQVDNMATHDDQPEHSDNLNVPASNRAAPFTGYATASGTRAGSPQGRHSRPVTGASHHLATNKSSRSKRSFVAVAEEAKSSKKPGMLKDLSELDPKILEALVYKTKSLESIQIEQLDEDTWIDMILNSDLKEVQYGTFKRLIKNRRILNKVSLHLMNIHEESKNVCKFTRNEIDYALSQTDKDLYVQFREKKLTYD